MKTKATARPQERPLSEDEAWAICEYAQLRLLQVFEIFDAPDVLFDELDYFTDQIAEGLRGDMRWGPNAPQTAKEGMPDAEASRVICENGERALREFDRRWNRQGLNCPDANIPESDSPDGVGPRTSN